MKLEVVLLSWGLRKVEEELGEAPSSKEEDEAEVEQLAGDDLWRFSGEVEGAQRWGRRESSSMV